MLDYESLDCQTADEFIGLIEKKDLELTEDILDSLEQLFNAESQEVLDNYDIKVSTNNRSFNELADMFIEGDIDLATEKAANRIANFLFE